MASRERRKSSWKGFEDYIEFSDICHEGSKKDVNHTICDILFARTEAPAMEMQYRALFQTISFERPKQCRARYKYKAVVEFRKSYDVKRCSFCLNQSMTLGKFLKEALDGSLNIRCLSIRYVRLESVELAQNFMDQTFFPGSQCSDVCEVHVLCFHLFQKAQRAV